jgi:hypothetical protein
MIAFWAFAATLSALCYFGAGAVYLLWVGRFRGPKITYLCGTALGGFFAVFSIVFARPVVEFQLNLTGWVLDQVGSAELALFLRELFPLILIAEFFLLGILCGYAAVWLALKLRKMPMHKKGF